MPGEDINTTLRFNTDISDYSAAMQEATKLANRAKSEFDVVASTMDDWSSSTDGLTAKLAQLAAEQTVGERKLEILRAAYEKAVEEQGEFSKAAIDLETRINRQQASVNKTAREHEKYSQKLEEVEKSADDAAEDVKKVGDAAKQAGEDAEDSAEGWTIVKDVISDLVSGAVQWGIDKFKELMTAGENAMSSLAARTGATTSEMQAYKDVMNDIYRNNYGESFDDIADAMGVTLQTFDDLDNASLQNITQNAIALRDTFGYDYQEVIRAVNSSMDQFGITADEAFNLIAQGAQNGLDQNGDLLDTINEYSVQFAQAGYSADDMFNMLKNGVDSGTWSVDKLGDAMKEFGLRAKDTSDATYNAFAQLGYDTGTLTKNIGETKDEIAELEKNLKYAKMEQAGFNEKTSELTRMKNAEKIEEYSSKLEGAKSALASMEEAQKASSESAAEWQERFAAGGETAKQATQELIDKIMSVEDPVDQLALGVQFFGTMWEDLGAQGVAAMLNTQGELSKTKTAMEDINNIKYDNLSSAWAGLGRIIETDLIQPLVETLAPVAKEIVEWLINNMQTLAPIIATVTAAVAAFAAVLAIQGIISSVTKAFALLNTTLLANPIVLVVAAIAGLVAAFVTLWNKSEAFRNFWKSLWEGIKSIVSSVADWFKKTTSNIAGFFSDAWKKIKDTWSNSIVGKYFNTVWNTIKGVFSVVKNVLSGNFSGAWDAIKKIFSGWGNFFSDLWSKAKNVFSTVDSWFGNIFSKAWQGIRNAFSNVGSFFSDVWSKIKSAFSLDGMLSIGRNLVEGLWSGLSGSLQWIKNKISGWVGDVLSFMKRQFGIHSPSDETEWQGEMLVEGYVRALRNGRQRMAEAMQGFARSGLAAMDDVTPDVGGAAGVGGKSISFTQINNSPKALSRREIYRQTHNALAYAGGM